MRIFYILFLVLFIAGCNTAKQAVKSIDKGFNKDSVAATKRVREIVPCVTLKQDTVLVHDTVPKIVHDTTKTVKDSLITLPCPDGSTVSTKIKYVTTTIRTTATVTKTFYITKTIEDKGKDIVIRDNQRQIEKQKGKTNFWMAWSIIATLIILLGVIVYLLGKSLNAKKI